MFVGGEFYADERWTLERPGIDTTGLTFLNGGKACLIVIADYLRAQGIQRVLLPAYLCPDISTTLERCGLACTYYDIRPDLSIDLADLERKATGERTVYFINYFGFPYPPETQEVLKGLQRQGSLLIEDNAQTGFWEHSIGDFVFNSLRKCCAHDGGYLATQLDVTAYIQRHRDAPNRRLPVIREYRARLAQYLYGNTDDYDELAALYELSERYYAEDMAVAGDPQEKEVIERLDWAGIRRARRENYAYLLDAIRDIPGLAAIFPTLTEDATPLGLPVYVNGMARDELWERLGEAGIGLTIHWQNIPYDARLKGSAGAVEMAVRMLTLACDQRTSRKQMDYMVKSTKSILREARIGQS
jgi:Predicted pyridoxal phosphate-dependent enzyme apparently involved in regulation of cell wall biogenesis